MKYRRRKWPSKPSRKTKITEEERVQIKEMRKVFRSIVDPLYNARLRLGSLTILEKGRSRYKKVLKEMRWGGNKADEKIARDLVEAIVQVGWEDYYINGYGYKITKLFE